MTLQASNYIMFMMVMCFAAFQICDSFLLLGGVLHNDIHNGFHRIKPSLIFSNDKTHHNNNHHSYNSIIHCASSTLLFGSTNSDGDDEAFSFGQRIESVKSGVVGALSGGLALAPLSALHDINFGEGTVENALAQWEFDTDVGSLEAALFAIVYRYCIRQDNNPMLNQGVISAFAAVRVLSKVQIPGYCGFAPLECGEPLGFYDWNVLSQLAWGGLESAALFGVAAAAMDYCFYRGIILKFRG